MFFPGYACVVDMGDQKTSISCVEDGISHSETRIHLDYGGADITQASLTISENYNRKWCNEMLSTSINIILSLIN
jgi:actin-related protein